MSRIDDLISDLCPDGVEHKPLGSLCNVFNGYAFKSELFNTDGIGLPLIRIRDVNTGFSKTYYSGDYDDRYVVSDGDILIGMDGNFQAVRWQHGQALLNQRVCRLQAFTPEVLPTFIYYKVQDELDRIQDGTQGSTVKHLSSRELERARIPVPPLEVQREIVRILDHFTELEAELEKDLNAEMIARRQQYEHYREALCSFDVRTERQAGKPAIITWMPMGELGTFIRGRRFVKTDQVEQGIPAIHYGEIYTHYGTHAISVITHLRPDIESTLRYARPGDVVIAAVGETVEDVGKAVAWLGTDDIAVHDDCFIFRHSMNPKFVSYYLQTEAYHSQKNKHVARAKVKRLSGESLAKLTIPIPPLPEQERIVAILDSFHGLVNNLSVGLPAELAGRRKQYEHYRDRLLTFEELPA